MRVQVVGATGYLGAGLCEVLARSGHEVLAWGRRKPDDASEWSKSLASFELGDISDEKTVDRLVEQKPEAIVYCVSLNHFQTEGDIESALGVNVLPVWRLLDTFRRANSSIRLVYLSTAQVYGCRKGVIEESSLPSVNNHYGLTHLLSESILSRYQSEFSNGLISLRIANGYGPPRFTDANCWWLVMNDFCKSVINSGCIRLKSDGSPRRNFIHIQDIYRAILLVLTRSRKDLQYSVYNVGGSVTYSIRELADIVAKVYEDTFQLSAQVLTPNNFRIQTVSSATFEYKIERLSSLGFVEETGLREGIKDLLLYLKRINEQDL